MGRLKGSDWAVVLISAPVIVLGAAWLAVLALGLGADDPVWRLHPTNVAEAAALRDGGAIVRRVWAGEDVNAAAEVRAGIIASEVRTLTPVEAALSARRPEIVRLLIYLGARPDAVGWTSAWCQSDDEVRDLLSQSRPEGATTECPR